MNKTKSALDRRKLAFAEKARTRYMETEENRSVCQIFFSLCSQGIENWTFYKYVLYDFTVFVIEKNLSEKVNKGLEQTPGYYNLTTPNAPFWNFSEKGKTERLHALDEYIHHLKTL